MVGATQLVVCDCLYSSHCRVAEVAGGAESGNLPHGVEVAVVGVHGDFWDYVGGFCVHATFRVDAEATFRAYRPLVYRRRLGVPEGLPEITPVVELLINQVRMVL